MTAKCQRCTAPSLNGFLCKTCATHLKAALAELPWWQRRLTEAALGQARMSDNGGRRSTRARDLHGDDWADRALGVITATGTHADQVDRAIRQKALARALAAGGVNATASQLLGRIADELSSWCRVLCEERGMQYAPTRIVDRASAYGEEHAVFLYANVRAITASECAGDIADDVLGRDRKRRGYVDDISRAINRPLRWWPLGECPEWVRAEGPVQRDEQTQINGPHPTARCGAELRARECAALVSCPDCGTAHDTHWLLRLRMDDAERQAKTWRQLRRFNSELPPEYAVAQRTLRQWRIMGRLPERGQRDGEPTYWWTDVRALAAEKPQKQTTGAAAKMGT